MARTDNDTWEITESVGATALGVAAARAAETEGENPLISDPFARVFLNAAGDGMWNWFAAPDLPAEIAEAEPDLKPRMQGMVDYMAARTSFFDQFAHAFDTELRRWATTSYGGAGWTDAGYTASTVRYR